MSARRIGFWYRLAALLVKPPLVVLFKREWRGMQHIPAEGGFITAINHNSHLDPLSYAHFQYNSGRVPRFLAKSGLFKASFVGAFLRGTAQIPVYRESTDAANAFRAAVDAVQRGECVAFYPEATLTRAPGLWPMRGKTGAARVALLTRAPVIPVAQWGANEVLPPYAKKPHLFPRKTLRVHAGPPVDLSAYYDQEPTADVLRAATDDIMRAVTDLLAEIRGEDAPAELYDYRAARAAGRAAAGPAADTGGPDAAPAEDGRVPSADDAPAAGDQEGREQQGASGVADATDPTADATAAPTDDPAASGAADAATTATGDPDGPAAPVGTGGTAAAASASGSAGTAGATGTATAARTSSAARTADAADRPAADARPADADQRPAEPPAAAEGETT